MRVHGIEVGVFRECEWVGVSMERDQVGYSCGCGGEG